MAPPLFLHGGGLLALGGRLTAGGEAKVAVLKALLAGGACAPGDGQEVKSSARRVGLDAAVLGEVGGVDVADALEGGGEIASSIGRAAVMKADGGVRAGVELEHEHLAVLADGGERLGIELHPQAFGDAGEFALGVEVQGGAEARSDRPGAPAGDQSDQRGIAALGAEAGEVPGVGRLAAC